MIKKLQRRFIRIALIALAAAMILVVLAVNAANWFSVRREMAETLSFIAQNGGPPGRDMMNGRFMDRNRHARSLISESNWFSVSFDEAGEVRDVDLSGYADMDEETAESLAKRAIESGKESAFLEDCLYRIMTGPHGERTALFLDCETKLSAVRNLALFSALACAGGILLAWLFVTLASRKAIEPTVRNMEQQKQFITNASHELKTPLTVISTNMELMMMEDPDSQWARSTLKQTAQMRRLVEEMVYLSRMEEENAPLTMEELSLKPLLEETAEPFAAMAEYQGKTMTAEAEEGLTLHGDRPSIQRLMSTLLDNAVKYAPAEGRIRAAIRGEGRQIVLTVSNDVSAPLTEEQCRQLFDRFYRADPSRSKEKQTGFGIGLAIARAIAEKHGGTVSAAMEGEGILTLTCRLPRGGRPGV